MYNINNKTQITSPTDSACTNIIAFSTDKTIVSSRVDVSAKNCSLLQRVDMHMYQPITQSAVTDDI